MFLNNLFKKERRGKAPPDWTAGREPGLCDNKSLPSPTSSSVSLNSDDDEEEDASQVKLTSRACPPYGAKSLMGFVSTCLAMQPTL